MKPLLLVVTIVFLFTKFVVTALAQCEGAIVLDLNKINRETQTLLDEFATNPDLRKEIVMIKAGDVFIPVVFIESADFRSIEQVGENKFAVMKKQTRLRSILDGILRGSAIVAGGLAFPLSPFAFANNEHNVGITAGSVGLGLLAALVLKKYTFEPLSAMLTHRYIAGVVRDITGTPTLLDKLIKKLTNNKIGRLLRALGARKYQRREFPLVIVPTSHRDFDDTVSELTEKFGTLSIEEIGGEEFARYLRQKQFPTPVISIDNDVSVAAKVSNSKSGMTVRRFSERMVNATAIRDFIAHFEDPNVPVSEALRGTKIDLIYDSGNLFYEKHDIESSKDGRLIGYAIVRNNVTDVHFPAVHDDELSKELAARYVFTLASLKDEKLEPAFDHNQSDNRVFYASVGNMMFAGNAESVEHLVSEVNSIIDPNKPNVLFGEGPSSETDLYSELMQAAKDLEQGSSSPRPEDRTID